MDLQLKLIRFKLSAESTAIIDYGTFKNHQFDSLSVQASTDFTT